MFLLLRVIIFIFVLLLMIRWLISLYNHHLRRRSTVSKHVFCYRTWLNTSSHSFSSYVYAYSPPSFAFFNPLHFLHWFERSLQMSLYGNINRISSRRWIRREREETLHSSVFVYKPKQSSGLSSFQATLFEDTHTLLQLHLHFFIF